MALFIVTNVELDTVGEIARVRWFPADHQKIGFRPGRNIVGMMEVVAAVDRGDVVEMRFDGPFGARYGGRLCKKLLPNGSATIVEAKSVPGRSLRDLPRI